MTRISIHKKEPLRNKILDWFKKNPTEVVEFDGEVIALLIKTDGIWGFYSKSRYGFGEDILSKIHHRLVVLNSGDE